MNLWTHAERASKDLHEQRCLLGRRQKDCVDGARYKCHDQDSPGPCHQRIIGSRSSELEDLERSQTNEGVSLPLVLQRSTLLIASSRSASSRHQDASPFNYVESAIINLQCIGCCVSFDCYHCFHCVVIGCRRNLVRLVHYGSQFASNNAGVDQF